MHDVLMSGFAMMFFQDLSLLRFQERMEDEIHGNSFPGDLHPEGDADEGAH